MKRTVMDMDAKKKGDILLSDDVFSLEPRRDILHRVVSWQRAKKRAGTAQTKSRGEIIGSGSKIYRQKGTGRARHSDKKANIFRGGAKAFGPKARDYAYSLPKKIRALGLKHALSAKSKMGELIILDKAEMKTPKTKILKNHLSALKISHVLFVDGENVNANFKLAARNIDHVNILPAKAINVYDILKHKHLALTKDAVEILEARFK